MFGPDRRRRRYPVPIYRSTVPRRRRDTAQRSSLSATLIPSSRSPGSGIQRATNHCNASLHRPMTFVSRAYLAPSRGASRPAWAISIRADEREAPHAAKSAACACRCSRTACAEEATLKVDASGDRLGGGDGGVATCACCGQPPSHARRIRTCGHSAGGMSALARADEVERGLRYL